MRSGRSVVTVAFLANVTVGILLAGGCSKTEEPTDNPAGPEGAMRGPGGPGGRRGGPGGRRNEPIAASATGGDIFQQKCTGCHGAKGQGGRAPNLTKVGDEPAAELRKIIHDGHGKMPAFGNQMTEAQIDAVVAYVKQLSAGK